MTGVLPIILADQRLSERRGIKAVIFGRSGIGKTSLLWTLPPETTLFFDLEAGDLAIEGWSGDTIRPRTWEECRDFAVFIGGPNPAIPEGRPYSQRHFNEACAKFGERCAQAATVRPPSASATDRSAASSIGGRALPRFAARRSIPAHAFELKKYRRGIEPLSSTCDNEHTAAALGQSEELGVEDPPRDCARGSKSHTRVRPFSPWRNEGGVLSRKA